MRKSAIVAYNLFKANVGKVVTPTELETAMNVGPYAGREVWILKKRLGLDISTNKDGRTVTGYVLNSMPEVEPALVTAHFNKSKAKAKDAKKVTKAKSKPVKSAAPKETVTEAPATAPTTAKTTNRDKIKAAAEKRGGKKVKIDLEAAEVPNVVTEEITTEALADELPEFLKRPVVAAE